VRRALPRGCGREGCATEGKQRSGRADDEDRARQAAATPAASQPVIFRAGLRTREREANFAAQTPSRAMHSGCLSGLVSLTVAGAAPEWPRADR